MMNQLKTIILLPKNDVLLFKYKKKDSMISKPMADLQVD